jgi:hypothetical protein
VLFEIILNAFFSKYGWLWGRTNNMGPLSPPFLLSEHQQTALAKALPAKMLAALLKLSNTPFLHIINMSKPL